MKTIPGRLTRRVVAEGLSGSRKSRTVCSQGLLHHPPALSQGVRSHFGRRAPLIFLEMSQQIQAKPGQSRDCLTGSVFGERLGFEAAVVGDRRAGLASCGLLQVEAGSAGPGGRC